MITTLTQEDALELCTRKTALFNRLNHTQYGDPDAYGATFELAKTGSEKRCQFSIIIARVEGKILARDAKIIVDPNATKMPLVLDLPGFRVAI